MIHENGQIDFVRIDSRNFAKEHNLEPGKIKQLLTGKLLEYKGWKVLEYPEKLKRGVKRKLKVEDFNRPGFKVKNLKTNKIIIENSARRFCLREQINLNNFYLLLRGNIKVYKNYCLLDFNHENYIPTNTTEYIEFLNEDGQIIKGEQIQEAIRLQELKNLIQIPSFSILKQNPELSIKGWRLHKIRYENDYFYKNID